MNDCFIDSELVAETAARSGPG